MNRIVFLLLCCSVLIVSGCATMGPMKGAASSNVIYTNAPADIAFKISCQALQGIGYRIELKEDDNLFVEGSYSNPVTGYSPVYARVEVVEESTGTKIIYGVNQAGTIKALDITGYYPRLANNIYKEISKKLETQSYRVQKK